ncbi:MAG: tRNA 2-thiouridine(34) synthase MnmA, partial [Propionibacteriaceae bacterium]|nr:tRNA 2-thiouridine(34) synthase MnmA [Propionibacteriaceae bacterium]
GLRLGRPAADGQPRYVTRIDGPTVVVGPKSSLRVDRLQVVRPVWCGGDDVAGDVAVDVQFRAHGEPLPATIHVAGDSVDVDLRRPAFGVAPGQTAAFYVGPMVLGSGTIERTG